MINIQFSNDKNGKRLAQRDGRTGAFTSGRLVRMNLDEAIALVASGQAKGYTKDGQPAVR